MTSTRSSPSLDELTSDFVRIDLNIAADTESLGTSAGVESIATSADMESVATSTNTEFTTSTATSTSTTTSANTTNTESEVSIENGAACESVLAILAEMNLSETISEAATPSNAFLDYFANHGLPLKPHMNPRNHFKRLATLKRWGNKKREKERHQMHTIVCNMFAKEEPVCDLVLELTGRDVSAMSKSRRKKVCFGSRFNIWKFVMRFSFGAGAGADINVHADIHQKNSFPKSYAKQCCLKLLLVTVGW
ncbi:hypothetical protein CcCBS67573_g09074 [Chytriomyces confervae]|uniref:Uncharacterized protein n=1 Tax=Chytriomyces confervae TaxID=246404 RepID=A0A507E9C3_9FUNG|nr:hypothetical protein CcCBS67573_g09074 [Chytriomyces confervae]